MMEFSTAFSGTVTIAALVALGIFVYPWLLARRGGGAIIVAATCVLALLFYRFDRGSGTAPALSAIFALLWAIAPAVTALLVRRLTR
jgi:hypothetical protein